MDVLGWDGERFEVRLRYHMRVCDSSVVFAAAFENVCGSSVARGRLRQGSATRTRNRHAYGPPYEGYARWAKDSREGPGVVGACLKDRSVACCKYVMSTVTCVEVEENLHSVLYRALPSSPASPGLKP